MGASMTDWANYFKIIIIQFVTRNWEYTLLFFVEDSIWLGLTCIRASIIWKQTGIIQNLNKSEHLFQHDWDGVPALKFWFSHHRFVSYRISLHTIVWLSKRKSAKFNTSVDFMAYIYFRTTRCVRIIPSMINWVPVDKLVQRVRHKNVHRSHRPLHNALHFWRSLQRRHSYFPDEWFRGKLYSKCSFGEVYRRLYGRKFRFTATLQLSRKT